MRRVLVAVGFLFLVIGLIQSGMADDVQKDIKKDPAQVVPSKEDAPKIEPAKDVPKKDSPKADVPKADPVKDAPKANPVKDAPKKEEAKIEVKKEEKKDNGMVKLGQVRGKVVNLDESKKSIKLSVPALNPDELRALLQAQDELARATLTPNSNALQKLQSIANAQNNIAQHTARLYSKTQDIDLTSTEDVIIRLERPVPQFDDRGKLVKFTSKDLAALKGDAKLPGYKGEFADLRTNQIVDVTLVRSKNAKMPKLKPGMKEIDPDILEELKPKISMIMIKGELKQPGQ